MKTPNWIAFTIVLAGLIVSGNPLPMSAITRPIEEKQLIRTYGVKINVDDIEKALSFYCDKLGFEVEDRRAYPAAVVLQSGGQAKLILNRVNKLGQFDPANSRLSFTLQVNDLDQAIKKMRSLEVEFGETAVRREGVGNAIYIKDAFGRLISLMHQTITKVEPFKEPRIYNFGFVVPDMRIGREFYSDKLGFAVRSEKYLPRDLPLGHHDDSFAFMLHYRGGVRPVKYDYMETAPFNTLIFQTSNLRATVEQLRRRGVKFVTTTPRKWKSGEFVLFEDPFGNISELLEVR